MTDTKKKDSEVHSFEDILERLQGVVQELEKGDLSLEKTLARFEEGMKLARKGTALLDDAEKRVEVLLKDPQGEDRVESFGAEERPS